VDRFIEDLVGGLNRPGAWGRGAHRTASIAQRDKERSMRLHGAFLVAAVDFNEESDPRGGRDPGRK
jgi:hypothetical protein